jgi:hypothetical protein
VIVGRRKEWKQSAASAIPRLTILVFQQMMQCKCSLCEENLMKPNSVMPSCTALAGLARNAEKSIARNATMTRNTHALTVNQKYQNLVGGSQIIQRSQRKEISQNDSYETTATKEPQPCEHWWQ